MTSSCIFRCCLHGERILVPTRGSIIMVMVSMEEIILVMVSMEDIITGPNSGPAGGPGELILYFR